jgi:hypothetical protein
MPELLPLDLIRLDGGTQTRSITDADTVHSYAVEMQRGDRFPPVVVFFDGQTHWLASGFHRYYAAESASLGRILADVRQGTQRDAVLFSVGENADHGLRRTNEDKRRAVRKLIEDPEWSQWSDRRIAEAARVHHDMVSDMRAELSPTAPGLPRMRTVERGGNTYQIDTANIGRTAPAQPSPEPANAPGATPSRPAGIREPERPNRAAITVQALQGIERAWGTLPDPFVAALDHPGFGIEQAERIAGWFDKLAQALRQRIERAG